jgi:hypothetical protein
MAKGKMPAFLGKETKGEEKGEAGKMPMGKGKGGFPMAKGRAKGKGKGKMAPPFGK